MQLLSIYSVLGSTFYWVRVYCC